MSRDCVYEETVPRVKRAAEVQTHRAMD